MAVEFLEAEYLFLYVLQMALEPSRVPKTWAAVIFSGCAEVLAGFRCCLFSLLVCCYCGCLCAAIVVLYVADVAGFLGDLPRLVSVLHYRFDNFLV